MKKLIIIIFMTLNIVIKSQIVYNFTQTVSSRNFTQDVIIKNGATVKFTGNFKFAKNVRVFVENTSSIILNQATFERLNANDIWFGIEMQGYPGIIKPCGGSTSAIFLNSTVKGAIIGVINIKVGSGQEMGAAVHIEGCTFDNALNVKLYNEIYYCGLNARIVNSTFITSSNQTQYLSSQINSIGIYNSNKIIQGNTFISTDLLAARNFLYLINYVGTISHNNFSTNGNLLMNQGIYIDDYSNYFKTSISYAMPEIIIKNNIIDDCLNPIWKRATSPSKWIFIESNDFLCTKCTGTDVAIIYLDGNYEKGFFKYNIFNKKTKIQMGSTGGLGFPFYGNKFDISKLEAYGTLGSSVSGISTGQQFECNQFTNNTNEDIHIGWGGAAVDQGYAYNTNVFSNKNEFANNSNFTNLYSNKSLKYFYYTPTTCNNLMYPCNVSNTTRTNITNNTSDQCLDENASHLTSAPPQDNSISGSYKTELLVSLSRFKQKISDLKSVYINPCYYENIKDNYNPILLQAVDFSDNNNLKNYINNKISYYQSLPSTNELYESKNLFLSTYLNMKREINNQIEKDLFIRVDIDSTISEDSIKSVYRTIAHSSSEFKIASLFLKLKKFDAAINIYNNIHNLYPLDFVDSLNAIKSAELTVLERNLYNSNRDYKDMSLSEINILRNIAEYSMTSAGRSACFILGRVFGECRPEEALFDVDNVSVSPQISISPNPSSGIVLIQINNTDNFENNYQLKIFNSSGSEQYSQQLMGIELENIDLDISSWQNGNYYVSVFVNGSIFTTKILQKINP